MHLGSIGSAQDAIAALGRILKGTLTIFLCSPNFPLASIVLCDQLYLHVTFGGIGPIQQRFISCPLHWETALKIYDSTKIVSNKSKTVIVEIILLYVPFIFLSGPIYYLCFSFIDIFLLHIFGHSKICHFTRFV